MAPVLAAAPPGRLGVAVSGGSDSTALLHLLRRWASARGRSLAAVTIDHGLRAGSADEAAGVSAACARLGVKHDILRWDGVRRGNLQMAAREARRALIAGWAKDRGIAAVAVGHTLDDQAETVLLRLARGSGVDGLAAMAPVSRCDGLVWLRPLLGTRREHLRTWLRREGIRWVDDPSNADPAFQRIRAREALAVLAPLGLAPERLAMTAARMAEARAALEADTRELAREAADPRPEGEVRLDPAALAAAPREIGLRLLAACLMWTTGSAYRPRIAPLEAVYEDAVTGSLTGGRTLAGAVLRPLQGGVAVRRETARLAPPVPVDDGAWDRRWHLVAYDPAAPPGLRIAALGSGGVSVLRKRGLRLAAPAEVLAATPAIIGPDGSIVAAPLAQPVGAWGFAIRPPVAPPWEERSLAPL